MKTITDVLNRIMNAKRAGKISCETPSSNLLISVLEVMKQNEYVNYKLNKETKKVLIEFIKLNECRVISPRFYVKYNELGKYIKRFLPSRSLGIIIISTSKGLLTHKEAEEKKLGGALIAYCY